MMTVNPLKVSALLSSVVLLAAACAPLDAVLPESLTADLAGENEVPAVATAASGEVSATLTGLTLSVEGEFEGLMSDLIEVAGSSAHVHQAAAGANGGVVFVLEVASADARSGTLSGEFVLSPAQRQAFRDGLYYVNIHTELNPAGELRAQLVADAPTFAAAERLFDATLLPENEGHPVSSDASGSAVGLLRVDGTITVSGTFADLEGALYDVGALGPAHVHEGVAGEDGGVAFALEVAANEAMTAGRFGASSQFTEEDVEDLLAGGFYVNLHTEPYPAGEIRGQLFPTTVETTTTLSGDAEVPPVTTAASGSATATASGFVFSLQGSFEGLESDLHAVGDLGPAHIHVAPADANGPVAFALDVTSSDERSGSLGLTDVVLSEQQRADFVAGRFYVNVHTVDNPAGEIRGQLEPF